MGPGKAHCYPILRNKKIKKKRQKTKENSEIKKKSIDILKVLV